MFKTLKELVRRVDFYLRNEEYRSPDRDYAVTHSIDDLFDDDDDPVRTKVYWGIRRFWVNHWLCNPRDVYRGCFYAYQRVTRGWDDRAVWSIDYWLDDKMPDMLRKLKEDKHGTPMEVFPTEAEYVSEDGNPTDAAHDIAIARWDEILDKMIAGFEASRRVKQGIYEDELGEYPLHRPKDVSNEDWKQVRHEHYLASKVLAERDEKIFEEGMALFAKFYWNLWD